jgi:CDP-archaeol synthase
MRELEQAIWLIVPLLVGSVVHGLCMRYQWLRSLAAPIDGGRSFRGVRIFGDNKTFRGIVAVGLGTGVGFLLRSSMLDTPYPSDPWLGRPTPLAFLFGFLVGASAMMFELPNSFLKRQFSIAPGKPGQGVLGTIFYVLDQVDLLPGVWLTMALVVPLSGGTMLWSALLLLVGHQVVTTSTYFLGMRKTWR